MAEPNPPPAADATGAAAATAPKPSTATTTTTTTTTATPTPILTTPPTASAAAAPNGSAAPYKAPQPSPLRMMGIPGLPKKLPSRNWMIFWTVLGTFSTAVIYDKREKKRATAKWARSVAHLAKEPLGNSQQLPRKLTVYLESPPGDGLLPSQEHYIEYIKPVLAASGLDWEFVQGRKEGDIRAAVAERIRRARDTDGSSRIEGQELTKDEIITAMRQKSGVPQYTGAKGDIVVGRHTWKEYMRGLHEGWLGPLTAPTTATPSSSVVDTTTSTAASSSGDPSNVVTTPEIVGVNEIRHDDSADDAKSSEKAAAEAAEKEKKEKEAEEAAKKSERPPQPIPYNKPIDYPSSPLPLLTPGEFSPAAPIQCPHVLGFSSTPQRLWRFLNRRKLADAVGREVAAVCLASAREWRENDVSSDSPDGQSAMNTAEYETALVNEEKNWPSKIWKEGEKGGVYNGANPAEGQEKIWTEPVVVDPRIAMRMRRFELLPEDEERAKAVVVPEVEIEGWIKGSLRELWQWMRAPAEPNPRWSIDGDFS